MIDSSISWKIVDGFLGVEELKEETNVGVVAVRQNGVAAFSGANSNAAHNDEVGASRSPVGLWGDGRISEAIGRPYRRCSEFDLQSRKIDASQLRH